MKIEKITSVERESLFPLKAESWRGPLSIEEFSNRNKRLYQHPYAKSQITTYAHKDQQNILASMDILQIKMLLKIQDKAETQNGFLLASCIVPKELRRKGYARELIKQFIEENGTTPGVLYSDIGPHFYSSFGFIQRKVFVVEGTEKENLAVDVSPLTLEVFVAGLEELRTKEILSHPEGATCLSLDLNFIDWQLEKFRYFAELKNTSFPTNVVFKVKHLKSEHLLLSVPNFVKNRQEGLFVTSGCVLCEDVLAGQAHSNGLKGYAYWDLIPPVHVKEKECPMVKTGHSQTLFVDPQWMDWW